MVITVESEVPSVRLSVPMPTPSFTMLTCSGVPPVRMGSMLCRKPVGPDGVPIRTENASSAVRVVPVAFSPIIS